MVAFPHIILFEDISTTLHWPHEYDRFAAPMCQLATISTALFAANLFTVRPAVPTPGLLAVDARRVEVIAARRRSSSSWRAAA
jgi:hypothetical protein